MMTVHRTAFAVPHAGILLTATLSAAPVLENLSQPAQDRSVAISLNEWQASSIRLSPDAGPWRVRSITVRMAQQIENESFTFRITGEAALRPALNDVRAEFTTPAISGTGTQNITFVVKDSPAPVLQPGQTYWLVGGVQRQDDNVTPSTGLYYWSYALNPTSDFAPAAGWSFGTTTASAGTLGSNWAPDATTPFTFSIDAVPESPEMTLARWRELHPGGPADHATWLSADHDRNGLVGLLDFAFNADRNSLPVISFDSTGLPTLEYVRWINAPELLYHIQTSSDMIAWTTVSDYDITLSAAGPERERVVVVLRQNPTRIFMRLQVVKQ